MTEGSATTVRWLVSLFAASIVLQRLSLPGGIVPLLLLVAYAWCVYGLVTGLLEFDPLRTKLFLAAGGCTAAAALVQTALVPVGNISLTSWGFFIAIAGLAALRLVDRSRATLLAAMHGCIRAGTWLAIACTVMLAVQLAGIRYVDYLAQVVPQQLLVSGYVITYPITWDSPIFRSNAWIGLEPSIISLQLGVCVLLAILLRARIRTILVLGAGMATTLSGSGIFLLLIGIPVMLIFPIRRNLYPYALPALGAVGVLLLTPMGQLLASRNTELGSSGSSASLRSVAPYRFLAQTWHADPIGAIVGFGAGSSQKLITASGIDGLLVPTPVKVFFDYGLIAGAVLAAFLLSNYLRIPMISVGVALLLSSWALQPATTTMVLALPTALFAAWWAPLVGRSLERDPPIPEELSHAPRAAANGVGAYAGAQRGEVG